MILAPVGNQLVLTVDKRSSIKEVGHFIKTVVIQAVGTQHLSAMAQHHILTGTHHLHLTIILGTLTYQGQCITLTEMNMSESLHRIGAFIEISNTSCGKALAENATDALCHVWLCHLSEENNHPELARKTVEQILRNYGIVAGKDFMLEVLKRKTPSEIYTLKATE